MAIDFEKLRRKWSPSENASWGYVPDAMNYRYAGYDNVDPLRNKLRNFKLSQQAKFNNADVPAVYDADFAKSQKALYTPFEIAMDTVGDAAFDAGAEKILGGTKGAKSAGGAAKAAKGAGGVKGFWSNSVKPNFGYSLKDGAKVFGKNLGGWTGAGTIIPGIMQGAQAIGSLGELDDLNKSTEDLINDIIVSANNNPLVNSYLTSDQKSLLRQAKTGKLEDELSMSLGDFMPDDLTDLLDIGKGALSGVLGGIPGMIVGGVGGAVNSGLDNAIDERSASTAELEALLYALQDAEMQYQSMKRPNFTGLGIQQRYQDMYR